MTIGESLITILYGLIGITGALSGAIFIWGITTYIARLGTVRRQEGIKVMEWGIGFLITSVVLIGIVKLIERWTSL